MCLWHVVCVWCWVEMGVCVVCVGLKWVARRPIPNSRAVCVPSIPQSLIYYTHTHTHTESLFPHKVRGISPNSFALWGSDGLV